MFCDVVRKGRIFTSMTFYSRKTVMVSNVEILILNQSSFQFLNKRWLTGNRPGSTRRETGRKNLLAQHPYYLVLYIDELSAPCQKLQQIETLMVMYSNILFLHLDLYVCSVEYCPVKYLTRYSTNFLLAISSLL